MVRIINISDKEEKFLKDNFQHKTIKELAFDLNWSCKKVVYRCKKLKLCKHKKEFALTDEQILFCKKNLYKGYRWLGRYFFGKDDTKGYKHIMRFLNKNGIIKYSCKDFDDTFFDNWSHDMSYYLGFIAADGYISNPKDKRHKNMLSINLQIKDDGVLKNFCQLLNYKKPLFYNFKENKVRMNCISEHLVKRLMQLGITYRKTYDGFPLNFEVPKEYRKSFVRGFFDGDGCVSLTTKAPSWKLKYSICSNTEDILIKIRNWIFEELEIYSKIFKYKGRVATINYNNHNALVIAKWMYSTPGYYYKRKFNKFIKYLHRPNKRKDKNFILIKKES